jgi:hypothetical protein
MIDNNFAVVSTNNCTSFFFDSMLEENNFRINVLNFTNYGIVSAYLSNIYYVSNFSFQFQTYEGNISIQNYYQSDAPGCYPLNEEYPDAVYVSSNYNYGNSALVSRKLNLSYIYYESPFLYNYGVYGLYFIFGTTVVCSFPCYSNSCPCSESLVSTILSCQNTTLFYLTTSCVYSFNSYEYMPIYPALNGWIVNTNQMLYGSQTYMYVPYMNISFEYSSNCLFIITFVDLGVQYTVLITNQNIVFNQTGISQYSGYANTSNQFPKVTYGGSYWNYFFVSFSKGYFPMSCNTSYTGYSTDNIADYCAQICTWNCDSCFESLDAPLGNNSSTNTMNNSTGSLNNTNTNNSTNTMNNSTGSPNNTNTNNATSGNSSIKGEGNGSNNNGTTSNSTCTRNLSVNHKRSLSFTQLCFNSSNTTIQSSNAQSYIVRSHSLFIFLLVLSIVLSSNNNFIS